MRKDRSKVKYFSCDEMRLGNLGLLFPKQKSSTLHHMLLYFLHFQMCEQLCNCKLVSGYSNVRDSSQLCKKWEIIAQKWWQFAGYWLDMGILLLLDMSSILGTYIKKELMFTKNSPRHRHCAKCSMCTEGRNFFMCQNMFF